MQVTRESRQKGRGDGKRRREEETAGDDMATLAGYGDHTVTLTATVDPDPAVSDSADCTVTIVATPEATMTR